MASRPQRSYPLGRVENYTDAVFAIAATLLVLDLTTTAFGGASTDAEGWAAFADVWPNLFAFILSFLLLSLLWMIHLRQFRDLARADSALVWLNNIRLLFIVLIPFTTSLSTTASGVVVGRLMLPLDFFLASLAGLATYTWASMRGGHLLKDDARADAAEENIGGLSAAVAGAVAVALAPWLGSTAFLAYLLNPLVDLVLLRRRRRRRRHPSS